MAFSLVNLSSFDSTFLDLGIVVTNLQFTLPLAEFIPLYTSLHSLMHLSSLWMHSLFGCTDAVQCTLNH